MSRRFSFVIAWVCLLILAAMPVASAYYLLNIDAFASLAKQSLLLPIHWASVTTGQWYGLWLLTFFYLATGVCSLYFLRSAFVNFSKGEFFNLSNSRNLRIFSVLLLAQALANPLHLSLSSILLSFNHPAGQKVLSISIGSSEIKTIILGMILWVISDLLVKGSKIESENKQFI